MSRNRPFGPPRLWELLIELATPARYRDEQVGDLLEGFERRRTDPRAARRWYRTQVMRSLPGALRLRWQTRKDTNNETEASMETVIQDLKYGLRALWKSPGFAVVSTITLALAIGVNTSIFSIVNVIVFADLPMQDSETIAMIRGTNAELGIDQGSVSPGDFLDLVERSRSFESLSALTESQMILTGADQPERVEGIQITAETFATWRLPPVVGRSFAEGEDRWGAAPVVMLTHGFWQARFGGRPDILGETLRLDGTEYTIIGVADPELEFADFARASVLTPLIINRSEPNRAVRYLFVTGRLAPGVSHAAATEEVRQIGERLAREYPVDNTGWGLWSAAAMDSLIDEEANTILLFLQLTVGMVILIACANVANMLLARATARAREIAVRSALGAGRGRLIRQLLTESMVISLAAGSLGVAFAYGLNEALILISAGTEEVFMMSELDGRVLTFTLLVSLAAPLAFGLLPALRASASGPQAALRDGRSSDGGRAGKRARSGLVVAQISLALTLMVVATLLTRTVIELQTRPLGFDPTDLLTARVTLPDNGYEEAGQQRIFFEQAREATSDVFGGIPVEMANVTPGVGYGPLRSLTIEGREVVEGRAAPTAYLVTVSRGYYDLLGLPITAGRGFEAADDAEAIPVAVLSRAIADRYWPEEDPIGRRFQVSGQDEWIQIVGIVADIRPPNDETESAMNIYLPFQQQPRQSMMVMARTDMDPASIAGPLRDAVATVDPNQPVDNIRTVERALYLDAASGYALLTLFVTFAVFALLMSAIGIYGVMAYTVSQRKSEIGLRMALGAERATVRWMIVSQGARLLGVGIAIGLVASLGLSQLLRNLVFGISATDPVTFVGVPLILAGVALVANLLPAVRAMRTDPATTLRAD